LHFSADGKAQNKEASKVQGYIHGINGYMRLRIMVRFFLFLFFIAALLLAINGLHFGIHGLIYYFRINSAGFQGFINHYYNDTVGVYICAAWLMFISLSIVACRCSTRIMHREKEDILDAELATLIKSKTGRKKRRMRGRGSKNVP